MKKQVMVVEFYLILLLASMFMLAASKPTQAALRDYRGLTSSAFSLPWRSAVDMVLERYKKELRGG